MTYQFSDAAIESALAAQRGEKLKWGVWRCGPKFQVRNIPEWGKDPITHAEHDSADDAHAHMETMRNRAAMRAALIAALEAEGK